MRSLRLILPLVLGANLTWTCLAWSDVAPPPAAVPCKELAAGDACTLLEGGTGTCVHHDSCVGPQGPYGFSGCLMCDPPSSEAGTPTEAGTGSEAGTGATPDSDDGGCSVSKKSVASTLGPWLFAAAVSGLLIALGRRRSS